MYSLVFLILLIGFSDARKCGTSCFCMVGGIAICDGLDLHQIPLNLPTNVFKIMLNDNSISTLPPKQILMDHYPNLQEISLLNNPVSCVQVYYYWQYYSISQDACQWTKRVVNRLSTRYGAFIHLLK